MSSTQNRIDRRSGGQSALIREMSAGVRLFGGLAEAAAPFEPAARDEICALRDRLVRIVDLAEEVRSTPEAPASGRSRGAVSGPQGQSAETHV